MRASLIALVSVLTCLSTAHCAPSEEEDGVSEDAFTTDADLAGKQGDDPIDIKNKNGSEFPGAFASPSIVREGDTYHAWMAKQRANGKVYNIAHATLSPDGKWKLQGDALPKLGKGAVHSGGYAVWAPGAAKIDANHWALYYSATLEGHGQKKCIWRARANSPDGPFVDDFDGPIECLDGGLWAIDPDLVQDAKGTWHLVARLDEPGGINTIKIRQLSDNALHFAPGSSWIELTHNRAKSWEQPVMENAAMVRLKPPGGGNPHWFVFYSGRAWANNSYAVGYADCGESINGPCDKKTVNGPWMATDADAKVFGPGTPTFYKDESGTQLMSVQVWRYSGGKANDKNNGQSMRTYALTIGDGYHPHADPLRVDY